MGNRVFLKGSGRQPAAEAERSGRVPASETLRFGLILRRDSSASSTRIQKERLEKIQKIVEDHSLKVVRCAPSCRIVHLEGTVANINAFMGLRLARYTGAEAEFRSYETKISVPRELALEVLSVVGLDNRRVASRVIRSEAGTSGNLSSAWKPQQLAERYQFPPGDGAGRHIAIIEFGGGYFEDDLKQFQVVCGLPPLLPVKVVSVDGTPTNVDSDDRREVMLDVELVAGFCPAASIALYFASPEVYGWCTALDDILSTAPLPDAISISWGGAEDVDFSDEDRGAIDGFFEEAAEKGVTVCVSAGDRGATDGQTDGKVHVHYPASSAFVLSVGGTTIQGNGTEVVWNQDAINGFPQGITGGGVSCKVQRPSWQAGLKVPSLRSGAMVGRIVPDVAANANWTLSPYFMVLRGQPAPGGGTSAGAPLWASLIALLNAARSQKGQGPVGFLTPQLYTVSGNQGTVGYQGCTGITDGNNTIGTVKGYEALQGFDAVTGWGTPLGVKLKTLLP